MRILLWHGYLLGGTGSNVYTRALAREWARSGHDVTVLSQEPHPEAYDLGGAAATRPEVGGFLPVFVLDRYEGYDDVRRLPDCTRDELERWVEVDGLTVDSARETFRGTYLDRGRGPRPSRPASRVARRVEDEDPEAPAGEGGAGSGNERASKRVGIVGDEDDRGFVVVAAQVVHDVQL